MSSTIRSKLSAVRSRHTSLSLATGVAAAVCSLLGALAVTMSFDWLLDLSYGTRAVLLAVNVGLIGWWLWRYTISPIVFGPDEEEAALWVERAYPEFQSRLISAIQLVRPAALAGASQSLIGALVRQTESMVANVQNPRVVNGDRCAKLSGLAAASLVVFIAIFVLISHVATPLILRAFLVTNIPVPRKTRVVMQPPADKEIFVARGDDLVIRAKAVGIVPDNGRIRLNFSGGSQDYSMDPEAEDTSIFSRKIENVQDSFTYRVKLYDGESEPMQVTVVARPTVVSIECIQHFPAYTGLEARPRQVGDLVLLAGSRLQMKIKASQDLKSTGEFDKARNAVRLSGSNAEMILTRSPGDPRELVTDAAGIALPDGTVGFSVNMVDTHGVVSKDPVVYRIDITPDMPPRVKVTNPIKKDVTLTQRGFERVGFEAVDDLKVGKMRIRYAMVQPSATSAPVDAAATQPAGQESGNVDPNDPSVRTIDLKLEGLSPQAPRGYYEWHMDQFPQRPAIGTVIQWWLEAEDLNNTGPQPGKGMSERYQFRIVSDADKMKELMEAAGDTGSLVNPLKESQEEAQQRLGPLIKGDVKPANNP